jgi:ribose-phosphate pyrophosphokinase
MIVFSTESFQYLKNELLSISNCTNGKVIARIFPDGEMYHQIVDDLIGAEIVLIGGTIDDKNTLELYDLANGIIQAGAKSLRIIIPYFGYATMERAVKAGEIVKAKNRALLFSSLPPCSEANRIYLLDLHAEGIPYYFDRDVRCIHLYAKPIIIEACHEIFQHDFVLASTDAGRAKWVESLANDMNVKSAFVYKHRVSGDETQITGVNADVKGQRVIIYDDMIRTGGSLMQAASAYEQAGASQIVAIATHGLFTNHALAKIADQGIISTVICTNSHPNAMLETASNLKVKSIAQLLFDKLNLK